MGGLTGWSRFIVLRVRGLPLLFLFLTYPGLALSSGHQAQSTSLVRVVRVDLNRVEIEVTCGPAEVYLTGDTISTFSVTVPGFDQDCIPFGPCLPVKGIALAIPPDAEPRVTIVEQRSRERDAPTARGRRPFKGEVTSPVEIGLVGFVRDLRVAQVLIHPVVYLASKQTIRVYDYIRFLVEFESGLVRPVDEPAPPDPMDPLLRSLVINPGYSGRFKVKRERDRIEDLLLSNNTERYRILVEQEGIYRVTGSELKAAGMDIESVAPRMIHLENLGRRVPIHLNGDGDGTLDEEDYIEFYGKGPRGEYTYFSLYSTCSVYWLFVGDSLGLQIIDEDGGLVETDPDLLEMPLSYHFDVHAEVESWFERLPDDTMAQQDMWFWDMVSASEQGIRDFALGIPEPDLNSDDTLAIRVGLQGLSHHDGIEPDHHSLIYVNDALAGGTYWDGQHMHLFSSEQEGTGLQNNVLSKTSNKLTLVMPGDSPAGSDDRVLVNWIEIGYERLYEASNDYIRFAKPRNGRKGLYQFSIGGFTNPDISVYKLDKSKLVNLSIKPVILFGDTSYQAEFQTRIVSEGVEFVALTESKRKSVVAIEMDEPSDLRSTMNGADIIVVVHDSLANAGEVCHHRSFIYVQVPFSGILVPSRGDSGPFG